jgi:hypothetical protein
MTDSPRIMPHPDDPPLTKKKKPSKSSSEPVDEVAAMIANLPDRIEASTEKDGWGLWSLGVGGFSSVLMLLQYTVGGVPLLVPAILGLVAIFLGVLGLMAAQRGLASNRLMSSLGILSSGVALGAIMVHLLVIAPAVAAVIDGATPTV